jgi:hypothetical protein
MSLTRNITLSVFLSLLVASTLNAATISWPIGIPPNSIPLGGLFGQYFSNMVTAIPTCTSPDWLIYGFNSTPGPTTYAKPLCRSGNGIIKTYLNTNAPVAPGFVISGFDALWAAQYVTIGSAVTATPGLITIVWAPPISTYWIPANPSGIGYDTAPVAIGTLNQAPGFIFTVWSWDASINWLTVWQWAKQDSSNTALGYLTLWNNTALNNTAVGSKALEANRGGKNNTAMWPEALWRNTTWDYNTAIWSNALLENTIWSNNTALGTSALANNNMSIGLPISNNTAIWFSSLFSNKWWAENTALWSSSLYKNISWNYNTAVGVEALWENTDSWNTAVGYRSLYKNIIWKNNTALWYAALRDNKNNNNTAIGSEAMLTASGVDNTALGSKALRQNNGSWNTALWQESMSGATGWVGNVSVGAKAADDLIDGDSNTIIGYDAGRGIGTDNNSDNNIAIGISSRIPTIWWANQLSIGNLIYGNNMNPASVGAGNIGIGWNPSYKLDVFGNANISTTLNVGSTTTIGWTATIAAMTTANGGITTPLWVNNTLQANSNLIQAATTNTFTAWSTNAFSAPNNNLTASTVNNTLTATLGDNIFTAGSENKFTALAWSGNVFSGIGNIFYSPSIFNNSAIFNGVVTFNGITNLNAITATTGNFTTSLTSPSGIFTTTLSSPTAIFSTSISTPSATIASSVVNSLRMTWTTPWPWQVLTSINASWDASWEDGIQRGTICTPAKPMIGIASNGNIICAP